MRHEGPGNYCRRGRGKGSDHASLIGDHSDFPDPLGFELARDPRDVEIADLHLLAAGHGHGVVEQNLVSDVDAGRSGGAKGELSAVLIRAVPQILKDVRLGDEWCLDGSAPSPPMCVPRIVRRSGTRLHATSHQPGRDLRSAPKITIIRPKFGVHRGNPG